MGDSNEVVPETRPEESPARAVTAQEREDPSIEYEKGIGSGPNGMREIQLFQGFQMNPLVSVGAAIGLWFFVIIISADEEQTHKDFNEAQTWITKSFTWLYIATQDWWLFFLFPLCYWYGHVKLGDDDEEPEFSDFSYFCMVFTAGVAIGLIFYGASEPLYHMTVSSRYKLQGTLNDNQLAQDALNVTIYHWGLQAWVVYGLVAVAQGFLCYRKGLPLCFRTTLAPVFGRATWGWLGDLIDVATIITIVAGLCTSLGLGAKQIVTGQRRLCLTKGIMSEAEKVDLSCWWIVVITLFATASVVCGLKIGVKTLSQLGFILGNLLLCTVFFLDSPWYILNVMVQTLGYHFQHLIELGFHCDAWGQLKDGEGRSTDGKGAASTWMNWWTIFYWGWWIAWAPFVGTFLARISRGRTILNVTAYVLSVPFCYSLAWFGTFGASAIRMHRRASFLEKYSTTNNINIVHKHSSCRPSNAGTCYDVPNGMLSGYTDKNYVTDHRLSPVCIYKSADGDGYWFDLMNQYYELGDFLSYISIAAIVLFFITSSDSGSLVVDLIAANGREAHVIQRVFWALTEGAVAVALLQSGRDSGGTKTTKALRAISICAGLPFTVLLMLMCTALWRALKIDQGHMPPRSRRIDWALPLYGGIFDYIEVVFSRGRFEKPANEDVKYFFIAVFCPPLLVWKSMRGLAEKQDGSGEKTDAVANSKNMDMFMAIASGALYLAFWVFHILAWARVNRGFAGLGWSFFVCFSCVVASCRHCIRRHYRIEGTGIEDFFVSLLLYPQALAQMTKQASQWPKSVV